MNVMFSASRPAAKLRSMPRQPRGSTDSSARARPLRGREEHQDRQILQDIVEPVFGAGGDEHDAPWTDLAILSPHPNSRATADDVVHLILGVDRLLVFAAPGEFVQAATHRCDPQELEVCLASSPARLEEIRDFVSFHPKAFPPGNESSDKAASANAVSLSRPAYWRSCPWPT